MTDVLCWWENIMCTHEGRLYSSSPSEVTSHVSLEKISHNFLGKPHVSNANYFYEQLNFDIKYEYSKN